MSDVPFLLRTKDNKMKYNLALGHLTSFLLSNFSHSMTPKLELLGYLRDPGFVSLSNQGLCAGWHRTRYFSL